MRTLGTEITQEAQESIRKSTGWIIGLSIVLILLGIAAILMPFAATLISASIFGWIFLFAGIVRIVKAFQSKPVRGFWLSLLLGILYIFAGFTLVSNLVEGAITLTLVLGSLFVVEGIFEIIAAVQARTGNELSWLVVMDGVITLILGILVLNEWPNNSFWLIGLYVGISLIFSGFSLLTIGSATRKAIA